MDISRPGLCFGFCFSFSLGLLALADVSGPPPYGASLLCLAWFGRTGQLGLPSCLFGHTASFGGWVGCCRGSALLLFPLPVLLACPVALLGLGGLAAAALLLLCRLPAPFAPLVVGGARPLRCASSPPPCLVFCGFSIVLRFSAFGC